jgi:hypothetical protein
MRYALTWQNDPSICNMLCNTLFVWRREFLAAFCFSLETYTYGLYVVLEYTQKCVSGAVVMTQQIHYFLASPPGEQRAFLIAIIEESLQSLDLHPVNTLDVNPVNSLQSTVRRAIERADIVIVDISGENPNVMFEAGIATTLNKSALFLTQAPLERIPISISWYQIILYNPDAPDGFDAVRTHLRLWVRSLLETRQARRENA